MENVLALLNVDKPSTELSTLPTTDYLGCAFSLCLSSSLVDTMQAAVLRQRPEAPSLNVGRSLMLPVREQREQTNVGGRL